MTGLFLPELSEHGFVVEAEAGRLKKRAVDLVARSLANKLRRRARLEPTTPVRVRWFAHVDVDESAAPDQSLGADDDGPRMFVLQRDVDVTGVSGTGVVAEGIRFSDGRVAIRWVTGEHRSTVTWDDLTAVYAIHGHNGATSIEWLD